MATLSIDFDSVEDNSVDLPASTPIPERFTRYLRLADIALLNTAREEQRRIKERIRPHVENYRRITGKH